MTFLTFVALVVVAVLLWRRVEDLEARVGELERAPAWSAAPVAASAAPEALAAPIPPPSPVPHTPARAAVAPPSPRVGRAPAEIAVSTIADQPPSSPSARAFGFEDIFGRKLPIWAGGVTLAVCGLLIVKYSIDAGLLSPLVRVVAGLLFGAGLIAGAETALRNDRHVRDPRVRQALAGAGVATLYGAILVAANVYHLVGPLTAFVGLALVTLMAGLLALRFGAPSAVLGLLGGLATPALVGAGEPSAPLLAAYLALTVGGLAALGRGRRWPWLGIAALTGGFGWGLMLVLPGALDAAASVSVSLYLLLLGIGLPVLLFGGARGTVVRLGGALAATAQLALLVASGGFAPLDWALFGLLAAAVTWLSRREPALADLPAPALAVALLLMALWPQPSAGLLALVLAGAAAIFGGSAVLRLWRPDGRPSDATAIGALAVATVALPLWHFGPLATRADAGLALLGAAASAGAAALGWRVAARHADERFAILASTAGALVAATAALALPAPAIAPAWAVVAGGTLLFAPRAADRRIETTAWAFALLVLPALLLAHAGEQPPLARAAGWQDSFSLAEALRWAVPAGIAALFAARARHASREASGALATLLAYVTAAQVTPPSLLPLLPAVGLAILGWRRRADAATLTAGALALLWAAAPLGRWLAGGLDALGAAPLFVSALPGSAAAATRLLAPALALALLIWRGGLPARFRPAGTAVAASLALVAAHVWWKQAFAIATSEQFVRLGLAERTAWEALLAFAALALHRKLPRVAEGLGAAALAHFAWFTLFLHNPLWRAQAVGAAPVLNLLLPAYGIALALLWAAGRIGLPAAVERGRQWALMLLLSLFAASELRQVAQGSLFAHGGAAPAEDIARSVLAIALAVGFLQWGIRKPDRDWRIASLLLMLGAAVKVFVFDVAGLDGLARIASFAALGFSLIGIGWLYSRHLPAPVNTSLAQAA